jgi:hypothetical protein
MTEYKKGDMVTVKKGSIVHSYNPSKKEYVLKRNQKVKVDYVSEYPYEDGHKKLTWAGAGHYWNWTDVENIVNDGTVNRCQ